MGAPTFFSLGHPGDSAGESDSAGGPKPERASAGSWPTLVVEAGYSEPLNELRRDMHWWFSASNHQVKIVLLVKFKRTNRKILIEKWEEEQLSRPGATRTRRFAAGIAPGPTLRQSITISQNATNPASYHVTRGALVLSFKLLFLRDPSPQEGDFIIDIPQLEEFAGDA